MVIVGSKLLDFGGGNDCHDGFIVLYHAKQISM